LFMWWEFELELLEDNGGSKFVIVGEMFWLIVENISSLKLTRSTNYFDVRFFMVFALKNLFINHVITENLEIVVTIRKRHRSYELNQIRISN